MLYKIYILYYILVYLKSRPRANELLAWCERTLSDEFYFRNIFISQQSYSPKLRMCTHILNLRCMMRVTLINRQ